MDNVRDTILAAFGEVAEVTNTELVSGLGDETPLLETGIDSLGFAILVVKLEEKLGFDPFTASDEPYYPRTVAEFIHFYEVHAASGTSASRVDRGKG